MTDVMEGVELTGSAQEYDNPQRTYNDRPMPGETVAQYLDRLPPIPVGTVDPQSLPQWYWIWTPLQKSASGDDQEFKVHGQQLLRDFQLATSWLSGNDVLAVQAQLRDGLRQDIASLASRYGVTTGKWLLRPAVKNVNRVWGLVAEAVVEGRLGPSAKVSTGEDQRHPDSPPVICVYTRDFTDVEDVKRVLQELARLKLVPAWGIKYKSDAYTHLEIYARNEWGLPPTIYDSKDMMCGDKDKDKDRGNSVSEGTEGSWAKVGRGGIPTGPRLQEILGKKSWRS